jgi:hypothetical protein
MIALFEADHPVRRRIMHYIGVQGFRLALAGIVVGMTTSPAYAYLDPGTGSIILQVLLGGVAGVALVGKLYWHKFLSLIGAGRQVEKGDRSGDAGGGRQ